MELARRYTSLRLLTFDMQLSMRLVVMSFRMTPFRSSSSICSHSSALAKSMMIQSNVFQQILSPIMVYPFITSHNPPSQDRAHKSIGLLPYLSVTTPKIHPPDTHQSPAASAYPRPAAQRDPPQSPLHSSDSTSHDRPHPDQGSLA